MAHTNKFCFQFIVLSVLFISMASCNQVRATPPATFVLTDTPAPTKTPSPTLQPTDTEHKITVNEVERSYLLYIPPGVESDQPVPVVFAFHGKGSSPSEMQSFTGFNDVADKAGFLVVYPEGIGRVWNDGLPITREYTKDIDESAFIRQILSDLGTIATIDTKRIYAAGFSNGAVLSYRLACEMSDVFAAIAPVSGVLVYSPCEPQQPVSIIHVHGLNDLSVPYQGAPPDFPSVEEGIKAWAQINGCTGSAQMDKQLNDLLTHTAYTSCKADTAVELYVFETGGHGWPSKYVWDASQSIWDFFAAHPKP